jgi:hypothetical protein
MKNNKEVVVVGDGKCSIVSYWLWFLGVDREGVFIWLAGSFNRSFVYNYYLIPFKGRSVLHIEFRVSQKVPFWTSGRLPALQPWAWQRD